MNSSFTCGDCLRAFSIAHLGCETHPDEPPVCVWCEDAEVSS